MARRSRKTTGTGTRGSNRNASHAKAETMADEDKGADVVSDVDEPTATASDPVVDTSTEAVPAGDEPAAEAPHAAADDTVVVGSAGEASVVGVEDDADRDTAVAPDAEVADPSDDGALSAASGEDSLTGGAGDDRIEDAVLLDEPDATGIGMPDAGDSTATIGAAEDATIASDGSPGDTPAGEGTAVVPPPPVERVVERRGPGFVPLVLGGLVAGAIGYAIPTFLTNPAGAPPADTAAGVVEVDPARVDALDAEIAALRDDVTGLAAGQDGDALVGRIDDLETRIAALEAAPVATEDDADAAADGDATASGGDMEVALDDVRGRVDGLADEIAAVTERVDAVAAEVAALPDVSGLGTQVEDVGTQVQEVRAQVETRLGEVEARVTELDEATRSVESEAEALARETARNQLGLAIETGAPYAEPLSVLGGDVPAPLASQAETGVPTREDLADAFPPLARDALREARSAGDGEGGLGGFFRAQLGARSLEPREGDDADAVLSRAEAMVRDGDLDGALAEIEALPQASRDVLSDWTARVRTRLDAEAALNDFLQEG